MEEIVDLTFASFVSKEYFEELQSILFYNEKQSSYRQKIRSAIAENGKPELVMKDDFITVRLDKEIFQETLFIVGGKENKNLLGIIIFKKANSIIELIHIALSPNCKNLKSENGKTILEEAIIVIPKMFNRLNDIKAIKIGYKSRLIKINY